ncbi:hypothetical protein HDU82_001981 [Entophlyctis luteolus]|nr:hypothetical protein HDU82_001981 [Entophlyctis luteolus]
MDYGPDDPTPSSPSTGCCATAKWKRQREQFPDHKFDYIDVDDFIDDSWTRKLNYSFIFFLTVKSVLVYTADLALLALMIESNAFSSTFQCNSTSATSISTSVASLFCAGHDITSMLAPTAARPWILLASIIMSLVLLLLDWRKGSIVIKSRDISYSLTNHVAYRYYVLKSYPHYCFFAEILNSRKTVDVLAFFVFFAFKSWKRLFLAELPRVYINALNMYDVLTTLIPSDYKYSNPIVQYFFAFDKLYASRASNGLSLAAAILSTFTIMMWFFSFCVIVVAFFVYFPLLYIIRGNLKEYVCHKIDKRISELLKKKSRKRTEEARKAELAELERIEKLKARAAADGSEISFKPAPPMGLTQRPTLPDVGVDLDAPDFDSISAYGSTFTGYGGHPVYPPPPPQPGPPPQFGMMAPGFIASQGMYGRNSPLPYVNGMMGGQPPPPPAVGGFGSPGVINGYPSLARSNNSDTPSGQSDGSSGHNYSSSSQQNLMDIMYTQPPGQPYPPRGYASTPPPGWSASPRTAGNTVVSVVSSNSSSYSKAPPSSQLAGDRRNVNSPVQATGGYSGVNGASVGPRQRNGGNVPQYQGPPRRGESRRGEQ